MSLLMRYSLDEPGFLVNLEADNARAIERKSKGCFHGAQRGHSPTCGVHGNMNTGKFQAYFPKVEEKEWRKVGAEQVIGVLLKSSKLQRNRDTNPEQYIFLRRYFWHQLNLKMRGSDLPTMDEEVSTATAIPNIQEKLKLTVDDPGESRGACSSTGPLLLYKPSQRLSALAINSFNEKPQASHNEKANRKIQKLNQWCPSQSIKTPLISLP
ncbi:hypothetical protein Tco_1165300 [Tanacetum coccineum]